MLKRILAGVGVSVASIALVATPSFADPIVSVPGVLETINPDGGTSITDGLKLDFAYSQMQVTRLGAGQLFEPSELPSADGVLFDVTNGTHAVVVLECGGGIGRALIGDGPNDENTNFVEGSNGIDGTAFWNTYESSSNLSADGKSGVVTNKVSSWLNGDVADVQLTMTYTYNYPNMWFNVKMDLALEGDAASCTSHRIYWYADSTLGASDEGDQFGGTTPAGAEVGGVTTPDGSVIEAFRQVAGQDLGWFAGNFTCPWGSGYYEDGNYTDPDPTAQTAGQCGGTGVSDGGWIGAYQDFPSTPASDTDVDNGFGVSSPSRTGLTDSITFDLLFADCANGLSALECADVAGADISGGGSNALPSTGVDVMEIVALASGATVLALAGVALLVIRRRRNA